MSKTQKLVFVIVAAILAYLAYAVYYDIHHQPATRGPVVTTQASPAPPNPQEIFSLVNNERVKAGLPALTADPRLDATSVTKCDRMIAGDFFSHTEPNGTGYQELIRTAGIPGLKWGGENIEAGVSTDPAQIVKYWMDSPGHRATILDARYSVVGTAVCHSDNYLNEGPQYIEVQQFVGL